MSDVRFEMSYLRWQIQMSDIKYCTVDTRYQIREVRYQSVRRQKSGVIYQILVKTPVSAIVGVNFSNNNSYNAIYCCRNIQCRILEICVLLTSGNYKTKELKKILGETIRRGNFACNQPFLPCKSTPGNSRAVCRRAAVTV